MYPFQRIKFSKLCKDWLLVASISLFFVLCGNVWSENLAPASFEEKISIDRIQLVTEQIHLIKNRLSQAQSQLANLQQLPNLISHRSERSNKHLLDKMLLDISVAKSNLESINIELADTQQRNNWLEKGIQEIENQLNVLNIFGLKFVPNEIDNVKDYRTDLRYQQKLHQLETSKINFLQQLANTATSILNLQNERYKQLTNQITAQKIMHVKQQQVKDELAFQQQQNYWLEHLNKLYQHLATLDPEQSKKEYSALEKEIFVASENANLAYSQSLIARYNDQIQQMQLSIMNSNSISLLNEINNQVQSFTKQVNRLGNNLKTRSELLKNHIDYLTPKKGADAEFQAYLAKLKEIERQYLKLNTSLEKLNQNLNQLHLDLDKGLQEKLSARQGLSNFGMQTLLDLGKEILLVPPLSFQVVKSLSAYVLKGIQTRSASTWSLILLLQTSFIFGFFFFRKLLQQLAERPTDWREQINSKWLCLQFLKRNFADLFVLTNLFALLYLLDVPISNYRFLVYLAFVWIVGKGLLTISRVCLVETPHHTAGGDDVLLYRRLRWVVLIGGVITAFTVFVHQLPLIYELKTLCAYLFLFLLLIVSLVLLRSWQVIPNLLLSNTDSPHPYLQKSMCVVGIVIPLLLLSNSFVGLLGFVNLIKTFAWYEGIFIVVLILHLLLRGLLSDGMEQLSRMMIQYVNNGWLWTEAFLKPLDRVLRITLLLTSFAVLFLLYGWDKKSPIVERLTWLLHYPLVTVLSTTITLISIIELTIVISIFYWTAKWIREFVYRLLLSRTKDMGLRNSLAILSQYSVIIIGAFFCLWVLDINLSALTVVASAFAFGIGLGLRDLFNNFASGFFLLLERPLRVGDIVNISGCEGEVIHIGSRAVTIRTWDHMELLVPNAEIFNKSFTNWTGRDNIVRSVAHIKISRFDNPHEVKIIIQNILSLHKEVLKEPLPEVFLKDMSDILMEFELRYYVNIRQVQSRVSVLSSVLMEIWDAFASHGIKPPYPQHEILLKNTTPLLGFEDGKIGE